MVIFIYGRQSVGPCRDTASDVGIHYHCGLLIKDRVMEKKKNTMAYAVYTICIVCALLAFGGNRDNLRTEYRNRAVADERWNALMDFAEKMEIIIM